MKGPVQTGGESTPNSIVPEVTSSDLGLSACDQKPSPQSEAAGRNQEGQSDGKSAQPSFAGGSTGPDTPTTLRISHEDARELLHDISAAGAKLSWYVAQFLDPEGITAACAVSEEAAASVPGEGIALSLSDRINALPEWARRHIHDIETKCDPAGDIRTIGELRDNVVALTAEIAELNQSIENITWACNKREKLQHTAEERSEDLAWQLKAAQQECERLTVDKEFYSRTKGRWKVRAAAAETLVGELRTQLQDAIGYLEGQNVGGMGKAKARWISVLASAEELLTRTLKKEDGKC